MNNRQKNVAQYCDGHRSSREIAQLCGDSQKYVQEVMLKFDLPRRKQGSASGEENGSWNGGRNIDRDGYAIVSAPACHPHARHRPNRPGKIIYEHRLVMEGKLGRYLLPSEVVDHVDGLRLHNAPDNLRLFQSNAEHLRTTISGQVPSWSCAGVRKLQLSNHLRAMTPPIHTYDRMKKNGDARLREILLTVLILGADSPYLLGTNRHLTKAGIFDLSHSNLERELAALCRKYA
nr:HNH homing endonuclease [Pectobacterium phage Ymer]